VEVDGGAYIGGRHTSGPGFEADCEKLSSAAALGWRVLRVTPRHVHDGRALTWLLAALEAVARERAKLRGVVELEVAESLLASTRAAAGDGPDELEVPPEAWSRREVRGTVDPELIPAPEEA
jgi:hypothetical protein